MSERFAMPVGNEVWAVSEADIRKAQTALLSGDMTTADIQLIDACLSYLVNRR